MTSLILRLSVPIAKGRSIPFIPNIIITPKRGTEKALIEIYYCFGEKAPGRFRILPEFYFSPFYISSGISYNNTKQMKRRTEMIFIVEDDIDIREMESYALRSSGFEVEPCGSGAELFEKLEGAEPKLILLDIMLPGEDGLSILSRLRAGEKTADAPVIMVTAKTSEIDKVRGLDQGADDYITKPFGVMELVSRVKALLRRAAPKEAEHEKLVSGAIVMDSDKRSVTVDGQEIELTFKEYELLYALMSNKGAVQSREKLISTVWGYDFAGETRTVDMHVKTLRQKLGESGRSIVTVRNVGYRMD